MSNPKKSEPLTLPAAPLSELTKREHFAALALQGLIASVTRTYDADGKTLAESPAGFFCSSEHKDLEEMLTTSAVEYADALILSLNSD